MRKLGMLAVGLALLVGLWAIGSTLATAQVYSNDPQIALMDNCDAAAFPAGLCVPVSHRSDVGFAEFVALLYSPLIKTVVGHPSWRIEPSYLDIRVGQTLKVANKGADSHTFTEVAAFGGGVVPVLNGVSDGGPFVGVPDPLTVAPECAKITPSDVLAPGQAAAVTPASGTHKFQCCIHPWMRAVVGVGN